MSPVQIAMLTSLAMIAFAANSLLCRLALQHDAIDPVSFTTIRLVAGTVVLWALSLMRNGRLRNGDIPRFFTITPVAIRPEGKRGGSPFLIPGNWLSALALFAYAAGFSLAYVSLSAATGALLLFGSVQATMIGYGLWRGERLQPAQMFGLLLAGGGVVGLLLPGLAAPPLLGVVFMIVAGVAWGVYSLRGRGAGDPTTITAGNFLRTVPMTLLMALLMAIFMRDHLLAGAAGIGYAIASGALASGVGYAIWYTALPHLRATTAATVQLSVPVIAAGGGILVLAEHLTLRLSLASAAILSGIALVILCKGKLGSG